MTPQTFFSEKYQYGYQKTQNFMLISNALNWALKNISLKSYGQKTYEKSTKSLNLAKFSMVFCP
jgi:hypothetical protein